MKTQKKSMKKKALLSSLSMLMVATVAVGSATFAWFTQSPTANAQGLTVKATASNGLKLITESHMAYNATKKIENVYASKDYLNYAVVDGNGASSPEAFLLNPASFGITNGEAPVGPFKTTAKEDSKSTADTTKPVTTATTGMSSTDVYKESIYCKLVGAASTTDTTKLQLAGLTITTPTSTETLKNAIRVLLTYTEVGKTEKIIGAYALSDHDNAKTLTSEGDTYTEASTGTYSFKVNTSASVLATKQPDGSYTGGIGTLGQSGNDKVTVYVYLDGEDTDCYSGNIKASDLVSSIDVQLSIPQ